MLKRFLRDIGSWGRWALMVGAGMILFFVILNFATARFSGNPVGNIASKTKALAQGNTTLLGG